MKTYNEQLLWPEGRKKAFTLSYDDAMTQDLRFLEMIRKAGVKATFNVNSGNFGDLMQAEVFGRTVHYDKLTAEQVKEAYEGMEVAAHGWQHCFLEDRDPGRNTYEVLRCRAELEQLLGHPVTGFAYAYGQDCDAAVDAVRAGGLHYARTTRSSHSFKLPEDFLRWDPTCHHSDPELFSLAEAFLNPGFNTADPAARLMYVWGHTHEFDAFDNWEQMEKLLDVISGHGDVWYATNEEICDYVTAFRRLVFTADSKYVYNPSVLPVWLGNSVDGTVIKEGPGETVCTETV